MHNSAIKDLGEGGCQEILWLYELEKDASELRSMENDLEAKLSVFIWIAKGVS